MGRANDVGQAKQRIGGRRLIREHVEPAAADLARYDGLAHGGFVHQLAARAIDDAHALLCLGDVFRVHDVARLRRQRRVQRDEIGALEKLVELHLLDADVTRALNRQEGIERDDAHAQAHGAISDDGADIAAADDAQRLGGDFHAHEAVLFPLASLRRHIGGGDFSGDRKHHRNGVFGGGDGIAEGRVHHDDALGGGSGNIDVVNADACASNDLQACGAFQQFGGRLGVGANGEAIIIADDFCELFLVLAQIGLEIDFDATILEDLDGGGGQSVGDENAGRHGINPSNV